MFGVHLMLGYRRLRDMCYYSDDPLVMRTLGCAVMVVRAIAYYP